jgi:hypothetical protein
MLEASTARAGEPSAAERRTIRPDRQLRGRAARRRTYRWTFDTGAYHHRLDVLPFFPSVAVTFDVREAAPPRSAALAPTAIRRIGEHSAGLKACTTSTMLTGIIRQVDVRLLKAAARLGLTKSWTSR